MIYAAPTVGIAPGDAPERERGASERPVFLNHLLGVV